MKNFRPRDYATTPFHTLFKHLEATVSRIGHDYTVCGWETYLNEQCKLIGPHFPVQQSQYSYYKSFYETAFKKYQAEKPYKDKDY